MTTHRVHMRALVLGLILTCVAALDNTTLIKAYGEVFGVRDIIENPSTMNHALNQLRKLGVEDVGRLCSLDDDTLARLVMHAALGNLILGLKDPYDTVKADLNTGRLVRKRAFTSTKYAILESLLLIAVVALGMAVWQRSQTPSKTSRFNGT